MKNLPETHKIYMRQWRKNNPQKRREIDFRWRQKYPEKYLHKKRVAQNRRRGAMGRHSLEDWQKLKEKYQNCCALCGRQEPFTDLWYQFLTQDHIIAIKNGGSNFIENIQPLCISCNNKKATK